MAEQNSTLQAKGITGITVSGFKSLRGESHIEIRNLTILAGANSSGKSSIMQPLLLMKQTLEADKNPITFLLDGPNAKFTSSDQFLPKQAINNPIQEFVVGIEVDHIQRLLNVFEKHLSGSNLIVSSAFYSPMSEGKELHLWYGMSHDEITKILPPQAENFPSALRGVSGGQEAKWSVDIDRCFLSLGLKYEDGDSAISGDINFNFYPIWDFKKHIRRLIHVPGIRSNPKRIYETANVNDKDFVGTFDNYVASIVNQWYTSQSKNLQDLVKQLKQLGLTNGIGSRRIDDAQVELLVGRTLKSVTAEDTVSLADVGFGVSQVLPVLVASLEAEPGQLVYIEQPELHLHPRAQIALAQILADAANRGVRIVVETHSDLLILGIQTLVAEGKLGTDKVKLHWFERDDNGVTHITPSDMNEDGSYEGWPEDFADVQFSAGNKYLDAVEKRQRESSNGD